MLEKVINLLKNHWIDKTPVFKFRLGRKERLFNFLWVVIAIRTSTGYVEINIFFYCLNLGIMHSIDTGQIVSLLLQTIKKKSFDYLLGDWLQGACIYIL